MNLRLITLYIIGIFSSLMSFAQGDEFSDSIFHIQEISVSAIKQGNELKSLPITSTVIDRNCVERHNIESMKQISYIAPNLFIPEYGSRITSSIYVRGIGARIDQPAVGLNVDNVPFMNKDNYDFNLTDIARIEMLRGPQSTLFGRNTMGGLINIYTLSPLNYQGLRIVGEYGNGNTWKAALSYYTKITPEFGLSISGSYYSTDGFFTNLYSGKKCDWEHSGNARLKLTWNPGLIQVENVFSLGINKQGGYPYEYLKTGQIEYNDTCFYKRTGITDGLSIKWKLGNVQFASITSYQYIDDNMTLDQDFLPVSYFTLTQAKKEHAFTEDIIAKGKHDRYNWVSGIFGFYKNCDMTAPVTFLDAGIENLIERHRNNANPDYPIRWQERTFPLYSDFTISTYGLAAYHQSTIKVDEWEFSAGLRLDYEKSTLNYGSQCNAKYDILDARNPDDITIYRTKEIAIDEQGKLSQDFIQLLPKVSAKYNIPTEFPFNTFFSIGKGYKAGGYNTQMFSDVLQQKVMQIMGLAANYSVNEIVSYKPETSWNFELGSHIATPDGTLSADVALFYIDIRNQQLTVFPDGTTTGRIMTNAGKSRSFGAEISAIWKPSDRIALLASYGYTNAKFRVFNNGITDFAGNYIPYAPQNTIFLNATYSIPVKNVEWLNNIIVDAHFKGIGKIYWNEDNTVTQPLYGLLGASLTFEHKNYSLKIWGENLTGTKYHTFYFVSMQNAFTQRGKGTTVGATLRINI